SLRDREDAAEQHCRNERTKKERATLLAHQITSPHWKTIRTSRKPPAARRGLLLKRKLSSSAHLETLSRSGTATGATPGHVARGDDLDPKRAVALVVRRGGGGPQRVEAVHRRARGRRRESRQLEHHPGARVELPHRNRQRLPLGNHLVLAARSYVGFTLRDELLAVAAQDDRYRRRTRTSDATAARGNGKGNGLSRGPLGAATRSAGSCSARGAAAEAETEGTATAAHVHAADIARAHVGVPGGLELAGFVGVDSGDVDDEGVGDAGDGAVRVLEYRSLVDRVAVVVVAPPVVDRREIHRLGVDELRARDGVVRAHPEAREQQVRDRPRLAGVVVLVVHEGVVVELMM